MTTPDPTDSVWAWLTSPHLDAPTVADWVGVGEGFSWDDPDLGQILHRLLDQATRAGVFGLADHEINLHEVHTDSIDYLITVTLPNGVTLASSPVAADQVIGDDSLSAVEAAVSALHTITGHVNALLTAAHDLGRPRAFTPLTAPPSTPDRRSTPDRSEPTMPSPDILVEQVRHSGETADQPTLIVIEGDPIDPWIRHTEYDPAPPGVGPEHHAQTLARFGELARLLGSTAAPLAAGVILPDHQVAYLRQVDDAAVTTTVSLGPDPVDDPATRRAIEEGLGTVLESMLEGHRHAVTRARAFAVEQVAVALGQPLPPQPPAPPTSRGR